MASCPEKLLEEFEEFQLDLEVEHILKKIKRDCVVDSGVVEFGEQLKQREREKQAAQAARALKVQEKWSPGCYPQLNTDWFIEGLDFCCGYWRNQFKRPLTPPPAPPPSPDASRVPPMHSPSRTPSQLPSKRRRGRR